MIPALPVAANQQECEVLREILPVAVLQTRRNKMAAEGWLGREHVQSQHVRIPFRSNLHQVWNTAHGIAFTIIPSVAFGRVSEETLEHDCAET